MNKNELIKQVALKADLSLKDATQAVEALVEVIGESLQAGDKVSLAGLGSFEVKEKPQRQGFNPLTQQPITIPASRVPVLKFGKAFKDLF